MRERARRLAHRSGRRGAFLAFLAVLSAAIGYSLLTAPAAHRADLLLPYPVWGWAWIAVGAVCAAGVPAQRDRLAFTAAEVIMAVQCLLSIDLWLVQHTPDGWISVVIWAAFALTVYVVAGWPEVPRVAALPDITPPSVP